MLRSGGVRRDKRQVDLRLLRGRKLDLGALRGILQPLQRHLVALRGQVQAALALELRDQPLHDALVKVVAAKGRVAIGRLQLYYAVADLQDRHVKRAATEVIHRDRLVLALVQAVRQGSCRGLVHNALDVQAGNLARVLGRLPLRIVKVRRYGNHRLSHRAAQVIFGSLLQLLQDHRRNLRGRVVLALRHDVDMVSLLHDLVRDHLHLVVDFIEAAPHEALDRVDRVFGVGDRLPLGHLAHEPLAILRERHNRRRRPATLFVRDHLGLATLHHGHAAVRRAQIDTNNLSHCSSPPPECLAARAARSFDLPTLACE